MHPCQAHTVTVKQTQFVKIIRVISASPIMRPETVDECLSQMKLHAVNLTLDSRQEGA